MKRSYRREGRASARPIRIVSGLQPSGPLHRGNCLGTIGPAVVLQAKGQALYSIADLHALTTVRDPAALRGYTRDVALYLLPAGLDPTIPLGLSGDGLRNRVMEIVTDSASVTDPKDPTGSTIVALYRLVASPEEVGPAEPTMARVRHTIGIT